MIPAIFDVRKVLLVDQYRFDKSDDLLPLLHTYTHEKRCVYVCVTYRHNKELNLWVTKKLEILYKYSEKPNITYLN